MISELTATVRAALDQRLSVARTLAVDLLRPVATDPDAPRPESGAATFRALPIAQGKAALAFASRWPVGSTVAARVTVTADGDRVIADVDGLPLELRWRGDDGATPALGQTLAFRVLAHRPEIVLQRLSTSPAGDARSSDASTRISHEAQALQASAVLASYGEHDERSIHFTAPLVRDARAGASVVDFDTGPTPVAHGDAAAPTVRTPSDPSLPFAPVVLSGPAWRDQPVELVIRRHRRDEWLDDPTQDDWCGELVIDLPNIGRVAGHLAWSMQGLRVRLDADREVSATALADAAPELAAAFIDMRLRVSALSIGHAIQGPSSGGRDER
jgi:hypothetical protein